MPIDSTVSQELRVIARQIGGRGLASDSLLWRTLFPLDHLRIDGRVPVGSSAQYLLASRLNSAKELIAVAWTPVSGADMEALKAVSSFLMNKERVLDSYFVRMVLILINYEQPAWIDISLGLEGTRMGPRTLRHSFVELSRTTRVHRTP